VIIIILSKVKVCLELAVSFLRRNDANNCCDQNGGSEGGTPC